MVREVVQMETVSDLLKTAERIRALEEAWHEGRRRRMERLRSCCTISICWIAIFPRYIQLLTAKEEARRSTIGEHRQLPIQLKLPVALDST